MDLRRVLIAKNKRAGSMDASAVLLAGDAPDVPRFRFREGCVSSCIVSLDSDTSDMCTGASCRGLPKFSTKVFSNTVVKLASRRCGALREMGNT